MVQLSHPYMTTGKTIALTMWTFIDKVMSLIFNTPSRFIIAILPRSKNLLISWLQSPSMVILESRKTKSITASTFPLQFAIKWWDQMPWSYLIVFWMLNFKPVFSLSSFTPIKRLFSSSSLPAIGGVSSAYLRMLAFLQEIFICFELFLLY